MTDVMLWLLSGLNLAIASLYLNLIFSWRRRVKRETAQFAELMGAVERLVDRYTDTLLLLPPAPAPRPENS